MQVKQEVTVLGAKKFKGDVDGKHYDSTKLYVALEVSERGGTEIGMSGAVWPFGKSDEFDKMTHLAFPVRAELTVEITTKGPEVLNFRPITDASKPQKVAN